MIHFGEVSRILRENGTPEDTPEGRKLREQGCFRDDHNDEAYLVDGRSYVAKTVHGVLCK